MGAPIVRIFKKRLRIDRNGRMPRHAAQGYPETIPAAEGIKSPAGLGFNFYGKFENSNFDFLDS